MASGKTETLLATAQLLAPQFDRLIAIKSTTDTRWDGMHVRARSGLQLSAASHDTLSGVRPQAGTLLVVDEAQFFPDLLNLFDRVLADKSVQCGLIAAGLDTDSHGRPFGQVQDVAAVLEARQDPNVFCESLFAVCSVPNCGRAAAYTAGASSGRPVGQGQVSVGDIGQYQPMCAKHFNAHTR